MRYDIIVKNVYHAEYDTPENAIKAVLTIKSTGCHDVYINEYKKHSDIARKLLLFNTNDVKLGCQGYMLIDEPTND